MSIVINRTAFNAKVNDDGSNTVGSLVDKQFIIDTLLDPIDAALALLLPLSGGTLSGALQATQLNLSSTGAQTGLLVGEGATTGNWGARISRSAGGPLLIGVPGGSNTLNIVSSAGSDLIVVGETGAIKFNTYTATTFVAGDKYLVVDASGNVHRSAIGPAS